MHANAYNAVSKCIPAWGGGGEGGAATALHRRSELPTLHACCPPQTSSAAICRAQVALLASCLGRPARVAPHRPRRAGRAALGRRRRRRCRRQWRPPYRPRCNPRPAGCGGCRGACRQRRAAGRGGRGGRHGWAARGARSLAAAVPVGPPLAHGGRWVGGGGGGHASQAGQRRRSQIGLAQPLGIRVLLLPQRPIPAPRRALLLRRLRRRLYGTAVPRFCLDSWRGRRRLALLRLAVFRLGLAVGPVLCRLAAAAGLLLGFCCCRRLLLCVRRDGGQLVEQGR